MRELTWSEPLKTTSPPRPPSPPSGPPSITRASRRNDAEPSPPLPERTWTTTWSMKVLTFMVPLYSTMRAGKDIPRPRGPGPALLGGGGLGFGDDRENGAVLGELHRAVLEGEEGEVAALADVGAGVDLGAALADQDRTGGDLLAIDRLDAQVLRIRVAPVTGRSGSSHFELLLRRWP